MNSSIVLLPNWIGDMLLALADSADDLETI